MLSKRGITALSRSELHSLRSQWLRSGKCYRCFHASLRQTAKDNSKPKIEPSTPVNAPNCGPTRKQRAAKVSEELQILQRDRPSPSIAETTSNTIQTPSSGSTGDSAAINQNASKGAMGDNDAATQEGPHAQGIQVNVRTDVSAGADTRAARKTGQPITVDDPSESSGGGTERGLGESSGERLTQPSKTTSEESKDDTVSAYMPINPETAQSLRDAVNTGLALSRDVVERLNLLSEPVLSIRERGPGELAQHLMRQQFIQFESEEQLAAALEEAKSAQKPAPGQLALSPRVSPISRKVQKKIIDTMVAGKYNNEGRSEGEKPHKQAVLNDIARATTVNDTYLHEDGQRLLAKVRSLLPASTVAPKTQPKAS